MFKALYRRQIYARNGLEELLEEWSADRLLKVLESLCKEVEERIVRLRRGSIGLRRLGHRGSNYTFSDQALTLDMGNRAGTHKF